MDTITQKICTVCGIEKPISEFFRQKRVACGRQPKCKTCDKFARKEWQQRNPIKSREQSKRYREVHPDRAKLSTANWRKENKEKYTESLLEWRRENHYNAITNSKKKAKKYNSPGEFSAAEWIALIEKYDNTCLRCGEVGNVTIDHVIPLSKGGRNSIDNIQPLCLSCNSKKQTKTIDYR